MNFYYSRLTKKNSIAKFAKISSLETFEKMSITKIKSRENNFRENQHPRKLRPSRHTICSRPHGLGCDWLTVSRDTG